MNTGSVRWATDESPYKNPTPSGLTKIGDSVVKGSPATPTATTIRKNPSSQTIRDWINKYSREYNIDPMLVTVQMNAESQSRHYDSKGNITTSPKDAQGSMQLRAGAAKDTGADRKDPKSNVMGGIRYMSQMMKRFNNDTITALAAYNWGPTNMSTFLKTHKLPKDFQYLPRETKKYINTIFSRMEAAKKTTFPPR